MRVFAVFMAVALVGVSQARADEVLTPAEAAKQEGTGKTVTVEFVVKSGHPVGEKQFRLFSEPTFKDKGAFAVHLTERALAKLPVKDPMSFLGKTVRVTGTVAKTMFSSVPQTRPGIVVDDAARIEVVEKKR